MYYGYMHECQSGNCFETEGVCVCACMYVRVCVQEREIEIVCV